MDALRRSLLVLSLAAAGAAAPATAEAFCGFYVAGADAKLFANATVVVLMRDGTRTVLSMQNEYQGPPEDFALVIPVPVVLRKDDVKTLRKELFDRVDQLASPRLVEYWEQDPCQAGLSDDIGTIGTGFGSGTGAGFGGRGESAVKIEAQFTVAEYEIVILSANDSTGLDTWLREHDYNIPAGAEPLLRTYVQQDMKFFVAKVDPRKVKFASDGRAMLSPLRFHYDTKDFTLPVRLGLINAPDPTTGAKQDLLIHILAPGVRYQVANYPNTTIPTNLDVQVRTKEEFGKFYTSLFDHTLERNPGAVVTEYAWAASNCDPCPGPDAALTNQELVELGADVLHGGTSGAATFSVGVPSVRQGKIVTSTGLDPDIVRRIGRSRINEMRHCLNVGLVKNPSLAGKLTLEFSVDAEGKASGAKVDSPTIKDPDVIACAVKAAERMTFPKPAGGVTVKVTYPLTFTRISNGTNTFVLTRLHARYDATSLGEDLSFEAAPALVGGREFYGTSGKLELGANVDLNAINNFQARYAIRHGWTGEMSCKTPQRGHWGGPPQGTSASMTKVATQLASAPRGGSLSNYVTASAGSQLGIAVPDEIGGPSAGPKPSAPEAPAEAKPAAPSTSSAAGCGCAQRDAARDPWPVWAVLLLPLCRRRRD